MALNFAVSCGPVVFRNLCSTKKMIKNWHGQWTGHVAFFSIRHSNPQQSNGKVIPSWKWKNDRSDQSHSSPCPSASMLLLLPPRHRPRLGKGRLGRRVGVRSGYLSAAGQGKINKMLLQKASRLTHSLTPTATATVPLPVSVWLSCLPLHRSPCPWPPSCCFALSRHSAAWSRIFLHWCPTK